MNEWKNSSEISTYGLCVCLCVCKCARREKKSALFTRSGKILMLWVKPSKCLLKNKKKMFAKKILTSYSQIAWTINPCLCWTSGNKMANFHSEQPTLFPVLDKPLFPVLDRSALPLRPIHHAHTSAFYRMFQTRADLSGIRLILYLIRPDSRDHLSNLSSAHGTLWNRQTSLK